LPACLDAAARPNVLLICVDDLKPVLGCYGDTRAKSPNIDRLAKRGVLFERAYCNQAICSPSRNALMTGVRPTTLGIYDLGTNFRSAASNTVTLSQHFMQHGYRAEGLGKILASLGEPALVMTHSMSGAYGWKLVENYGELIVKLVAIAPGPPGNIQSVSDIVSETADTVVVRSSVTLTINLRQPVISDRNFVEVKLVGASTQFPREQTGLYASSLVPIPPRLLYQRRNIRGSQLKIGDPSNYRGKRILVMTGTADADHPRKLDEGIVTWLNEHGAKADFIYLGDRGITGNGHMVLENNSTALAHQIMAWIEGV